MRESEWKPRRRRIPGWAWAVVGLVALVVAVLHLDERIESVEDRLAYRPPEATEDGVPASVTAGQTVYVPVYSHIYYGGGRPIQVETTLSVHNVDPNTPIVLESLRYFDTGGVLLREELAGPLRLGPLATAEFLVPEREVGGGSGGNFLLVWVAEAETVAPLVETIMVGMVQQRAFAFTSRGMVVAEMPPAGGAAEPAADEPPEE